MLIEKIKTFIVEDERTTRRSLRKMGYKGSFDEVEMLLMDKHSKDFSKYLDKISESDIGLMSESGLPCIADPGAKIVALAHRKNIKVMPLSGPSSLFLALMASGMNGQSFAFNGYLPIDRKDRERQIAFFEGMAQKRQQSQIFIEVPYRNNHLFQSFLEVCNPETMLCVASNLMQQDEFIKTLKIAEWRKQNIDIYKKNTVFILNSHIF
ncbi:S-adenosylmethionine-dependent methyltransferase [Bacteroidia bacterium]|nr:S-adenosylmethionine-dependent methyltransferase [Bacteroidia bacterium]